jgi:hypothetical protein
VKEERGEGEGKGTNGAKVIEGVELGRETAVDAEELLVHDRSEGEGAERVHAGVVDLFGVFVLACFRQKGRGVVSFSIQLRQKSTLLLCEQERAEHA